MKVGMTESVPSNHAGDADQRGRFGKFLRWLLGPIFYWLDLTDGRTHRPSNAKVVYTAAVAVSLVGLIRFGIVVSASDRGLTLEFILYLTAVLAFAAGVDTFKTWLKTRASGSTDAQAGREVAAPERPQAERPKL